MEKEKKGIIWNSILRECLGIFKKWNKNNKKLEKIITFLILLNLLSKTVRDSLSMFVMGRILFRGV